MLVWLPRLCDSSCPSRPSMRNRRRSSDSPRAEGREGKMNKSFLYVSKARLQYRDGLRHAWLGEIAEPVVYGVQGALREYYGTPADRLSLPSTLDHIVAAVAG